MALHQENSSVRLYPLPIPPIGNLLPERIHKHQAGPSQSVQFERPLPGIVRYTYSCRETDPSRVLDRYCLEHIYRLFSDPRSDPQEFYRSSASSRASNTVKRWAVTPLSHEPLDFPALPFYCIGRAGTHYPQLQDG